MRGRAALLRRVAMPPSQGPCAGSPAWREIHAGAVRGTNGLIDKILFNCDHSQF